MSTSRRSSLCHYTFAWCTLAALCGCGSTVLRPQSPEPLDALISNVRLVGDYARPFGTHPIKVEGIGLVTGLKGTGSDPAPSPLRAQMLEEMQTRDVENPNQVLASPSTALVLVRGLILPGKNKGEAFDVRVVLPNRSEATSLRGGMLLETRLTEIANASGLRGRYLAVAKGPVLVDAADEQTEDKVALRKGNVLGGARVVEPRTVGLSIRGSSASVGASVQIARALNGRFHNHSYGPGQKGVANPKTDEFVELAIDRRYRHNVARYFSVIRSIAVRETDVQRLERMQLLESQLLDPVTAATAALRLEAIGQHSADVLKKGLESTDTYVRFYAAESLAYLDDAAAARPLAKFASKEPAFRAYALAALSAMDDVSAYDELTQLLSSNSAETRYGAFRALWLMDPRDPVVRGLPTSGDFSLHVVQGDGPPMVHIAREHRPEIVLFGRDQRFHTPLALEVGNDIIVRYIGKGSVEVSKIFIDRSFEGSPVRDEKLVVTDRVFDVIQAMSKLGARYPQIVAMLSGAKRQGVLRSRLAVGALPKGNRTHVDDVRIERRLPSEFAGSDRSVEANADR
ncbi:MAG: flagellar basal body P-ring protein FlgI [Pirellulales bacterium]|nr:flagellar basal body P-ring protein FlgI [Pirellulales bacterium]